MEIFAPKYRRNPNEKIESIYSGVAPGHRTLTKIVARSRTEDSMTAARTYGPGLVPGEGGRIAVLVLGGMETTLDEMEYLIEEKQNQKFAPRRGLSEIAAMGHLLIQRRNQQIEDRRKYLKANPSEAPKKKTVRLHLPVGYRYVGTSEPGFKVLARV